MQVIQEAYDTLSDLQERAFYDKHRVQILGGGRSMETPGLTYGYEHNFKTFQMISTCAKYWIQQFWLIEITFFSFSCFETPHLTGSDYKDDSVNVMTFFRASCYSGFNDDPQGFYCVYSDLFNSISEEDRK